jgi:hypothetical protein
MCAAPLTGTWHTTLRSRRSAHADRHPNRQVRTEKPMTDTSTADTAANREIIRQAFDAWRQGTGAVTGTFAPA